MDEHLAGAQWANKLRTYSVEQLVASLRLNERSTGPTRATWKTSHKKCRSQTQATRTPPTRLIGPTGDPIHHPLHRALSRDHEFTSLLPLLTAAWYTHNVFEFRGLHDLLGFATLVGGPHLHRLQTVQLADDLFAGTGLCKHWQDRAFVGIPGRLVLVDAADAFFAGAAVALFKTPLLWSDREDGASPEPAWRAAMFARRAVVLGLLGALLRSVDTVLLRYYTTVHVDPPADDAERVCELLAVPAPCEEEERRDFASLDWSRTLSPALPSLRRIGFRVPVGRGAAMIYLAPRAEPHRDDWEWDGRKVCAECALPATGWGMPCWSEISLWEEWRQMAKKSGRQEAAVGAAEVHDCTCTACSYHKSTEPIQRTARRMELWGSGLEMRPFFEGFVRRQVGIYA